MGQTKEYIRVFRKLKIVFKKLRKFFRAKINEIEIFAVDVLYDRKKSHSLFFLTFALKALSFLFLFVVKIRFWLYNNGVWRRQHLGCPVVVVGNLTLGGTGKTPVVENLAKKFQRDGRKVAILSRGYKSKPEKKYKALWRWLTNADEEPPKIVSDGITVKLNSYIAGDEPYMLAKNLPGVVVIVDKDRVKAGYYAIKHFGVDTIILDDGFQYLPLQGHLNLLLVDTTNPFGNRNVLPRGILREPISHVKRASYVLLTKSSGDDAALVADIKKYNKHAKIISCNHKPMYLRSFSGASVLDISDIKGKKIALFSGIASPQGFEDFIINSGANIVFNKRFIDHHRFTNDELRYIYQSAESRSADMIITTEKDAVRISSELGMCVPLYFLKIEIEITSGQDILAEAVGRLKK